MGIFVSREILPELLNTKRKNKKVVFTNGCFDILHIGHVRYLQQAQGLGDILVVAVNTDLSVKKLKGPSRPLQSEFDRAEILAALACVDYTVLFDEETPLQIIQELNPDILVKGGDYKISEIVGADFVLQNGGKVETLQFVDGKSTTQIVSKMNSSPIK